MGPLNLALLRKAVASLSCHTVYIAVARSLYTILSILTHHLYSAHNILQIITISEFRTHTHTHKVWQKKECVCHETKIANTHQRSRAVRSRLIVKFSGRLCTCCWLLHVERARRMARDSQLVQFSPVKPMSIRSGCCVHPADTMKQRSTHFMPSIFYAGNGVSYLAVG